MESRLSLIRFFRTYNFPEVTNSLIVNGIDYLEKNIDAEVTDPDIDDMWLCNWSQTWWRLHIA